MKRAEQFLFAWMGMSLIVLVIPILLGLRMDLEYTTKTRMFLSKEWIVRGALMSVGAMGPMLADFYYLGLSHSSHRFWNRLVLLATILLTSMGLLCLVSMELSDPLYVTLLVSLMAIQWNVLQGTILSYLHRSDGPADLRKAAQIYAFACLLVFCTRHYTFFNHIESLDKISTLLQNLAHAVFFWKCWHSWASLDEAVCPHHRNIKNALIVNGVVVASRLFLMSLYMFEVSHFNPVVILALSYFFMMMNFALIRRQTTDENARVVELLAAKRNFVRYIAHEMRTPLNVCTIGLQMAAEQVKRRQPDKFNFPLLEDTLEDSSNAVGEAVDILNEMLLFDRIEHGTFELDKERFSLTALVQSVYRSFFVQAQQKRLKYSLQMDPSVGDLLVDADKKKTTQAIRNFISNALKFTPEGGSVVVRVARLSSSSPGGCVARVEVEDSGVGIEKENQGKLFFEVVQFHAAQLQAGGGSGLGLTITKAIMDAHGGSVGVISELGKGSTFYFELDAFDGDELGETEDAGPEKGPIFYPKERSLELSSPLTISDSEDDIKTMPLGAKKVAIPTTQGLHSSSGELHIGRVLLVDDSPLNLKMMKKLMTSYADVILTAKNGKEAAELVEASLRESPGSAQIDLILTDYHMPLMDGIALTAHVRAAKYGGFIALITGVDTEDATAMSAFYDSGGNMILPKPIRMDGLTRVLLACVDLADESAGVESC